MERKLKDLLANALKRLADYLRARVRTGHIHFFVHMGELRQHRFYEWAMLGLARDLYYVIGEEWPDDDEGGSARLVELEVVGS